MNERRPTFRIVTASIAFFLATGSVAVRGADSATEGAGDEITPCNMRQTRAALVEFIRAFNAGDYRTLHGLFADPSSFRWYSSNTPGERLGVKALNRATLISYFRSRRAQQDRLRLLLFQFNGNSNGFGNFIWKMRRSAADFRRGAWFGLEAKGAALCRTDSVRFVVMSLGALVTRTNP